MCNEESQELLVRLQLGLQLNVRVVGKLDTHNLRRSKLLQSGLFTQTGVLAGWHLAASPPALQIRWVFYLK